MQTKKSKGRPPLPQPQQNHLIKKNQSAEVLLIVAHDLARALVPAHPATGNMLQRGGGTDAEADHDPHIVPDTPGGAWQDAAVTLVTTGTAVV